MRKDSARLPAIDSSIRLVRGERVILDADLAEIYGVTTKALKQAVRRNREKFPADFLFELTLTEAVNLQSADKSADANSWSQIVTLKRGKNAKFAPYAFTEHGAIMVANILRSPRAVYMSVFVVRAFIRMRAAFADTRELARKLASLEQELTSRLDYHESAIVDVLQRIMALLAPPPPPPEPPAKELGFHTGIIPAKNA